MQLFTYKIPISSLFEIDCYIIFYYRMQNTHYFQVILILQEFINIL